MKTFLMILNLFLAIGIVWQVTGFFKKETPELTIVRKERKAGTESTPTAASTGTSLPEYEDAVLSVNRKNIFNLNRCPETLSARGGSQIALLGTYTVGPLRGAIFKQSQQVRRVPYGPMVNRGGRQQQQTRQIPLKRFVKLGDTLENGYTLTEVYPNRVVLSRGGGTMEMYLERASTNSPSSLAAAAAAARRSRPNAQQLQTMMMGQQLRMMRQLIQNVNQQRGGTNNRSTRSR